MAERKSSGMLLGGKRVDLGTMLGKVGCILGGVIIGSAIGNAIGKKDAVSGVDLLGLDGDTSGYTTPALISLVGATACHMAKSDMLKHVGMGIMASGGAKLVNTISGKSLVSLAGAEDESTSETPVLLPGIGDVENYNELPNENQWATASNEQTIDPVASDVEGPVGGVTTLL